MPPIAPIMSFDPSDVAGNFSTYASALTEMLVQLGLLGLTCIGVTKTKASCGHLSKYLELAQHRRQEWMTHA